MAGESAFQRLAAGASILAGLLGWISTGLLLAAVDFDMQAVFDPGSMIAIGSRGANLARWGMLADVFGYYLLLAPLAVLLWNRLKPQGASRVTLCTFCGLAFILIGATGATIWAAVLPPLILEYGEASPARREMLSVVFDAVVNAVYRGLFNPLEAIVGSAWWLGLGPLIWRDRPALGVATMVLGSFALLDAVGRILNVEPIFLAGLAGMLSLIPIWALWFGIDLLHVSPPGGPE